MKWLCAIALLLSLSIRQSAAAEDPGRPWVSQRGLLPASFGSPADVGAAGAPLRRDDPAIRQLRVSLPMQTRQTRFERLVWLLRSRRLQVNYALN